MNPADAVLDKDAGAGYRHWRLAVEGGNLLARTDPVALAGGGAFFLLLLIGGAQLARWLARLRTEAPRDGAAG